MWSIYRAKRRFFKLLIRLLASSVKMPGRNIVEKVNGNVGIVIPDNHKV